MARTSAAILLELPDRGNEGVFNTVNVFDKYERRKR